MMEEIKNLMETIQKENKNAIVVWSEDTDNGTACDMFNSSNYGCNSCRNA